MSLQGFCSSCIECGRAFAVPQLQHLHGGWQRGCLQAGTGGQCGSAGFLPLGDGRGRAAKAGVEAEFMGLGGRGHLSGSTRERGGT